MDNYFWSAILVISLLVVQFILVAKIKSTRFSFFFSVITIMFYLTLNTKLARDSQVILLMAIMIILIYLIYILSKRMKK